MERFAEGRPLGPEDFEDGRRSHRGWGTATLAKATLQKLFFHGRLLIAGRQSNRRLYDLPERVLPPPVLALPESTPADVARWAALTRLRQHRLVLPQERRSSPSSRTWSSALRSRDARWSTACARTCSLFRNSGRGALGRAAAPGTPGPHHLRQEGDLRPFGISNYTWEVYTPPAKRKRGYYALPILSGPGARGPRRREGRPRRRAARDCLAQGPTGPSRGLPRSGSSPDSSASSPVRLEGRRGGSGPRRAQAQTTRTGCRPWRIPALLGEPVAQALTARAIRLLTVPTLSPRAAPISS